MKTETTGATAVRSHQKWYLPVIVGLVILAVLLVPPVIVYSGKYRIYRTIEDVPQANVGIVFGAGVRRDGIPTGVLMDRLDTAYDLYKEGKIEKLLLSGATDNGKYNEPQAMSNYLSSLGVPVEDMVQDTSGSRTYDTCYRAHHTYGISEAVLITQGYHLPRGIFLCSALGIRSTGLSATRDSYEGEWYYKLREIAALYTSVLDIYVFKPQPETGEPVKIL
ncbi:MAG: ElyC/SanA/YdcF family protein [Candidatus Dojkabacteria bacterium]|nr:ElyC/SanA/YdcF family protein [Candidatus Dojkabacteria bacterium]